MGLLQTSKTLRHAGVSQAGSESGEGGTLMNILLK